MENLIKTSQPNSRSNPRAISVRIEARDIHALARQRRHDLRIGKQPAYIDTGYSDLNEIIMAPLSGPSFKQICADRRSTRDMKRAMKSNAAVATIGIITFGHEAQTAFGRLDNATQARAILDVAKALSEFMKNTVHGLVIHRDETAFHAHFYMPAYNLEGRPTSQATGKKVTSQLQDIAAATIARYAPDIERGTRKAERLAAGATFSETLHRSVRELHEDLPAEIAAERVKLDLLQKRVAEMSARVEGLQEREQLSQKEVKRLTIYESRLRERAAAVHDSEKRIELLDKQLVGRVRQVEESLAAAQREKDRGL